VDVLRHSRGQTPPDETGLTPPGDIVQGDEVGSAMLRLREFMFERVYLGPSAQAERPRIERMLRALFDHYLEELGDEQRVVDWLAGMTDRYAIREFEKLSVPQGF
jgi:dGTPase